jgi:hypothetical protein
MSRPNHPETIDAAQLAGVTGGRSPAADEAIRAFASQLTTTLGEVKLGQEQQSSQVRDMIMQRLMTSSGGGGLGGAR